MGVNIENCTSTKLKDGKCSLYFCSPNETKNMVKESDKTQEKNTESYANLLKSLISAINKQSRIDNSFGSYYEDDNGNVTYIKEVIYNDPAVVVIWNDGTKTVSKCDYGDNFNPEFGLILCVLKKIVGNEQVAKLLMNWVPNDINGLTKITLRDVFKKQS